MVPTGIDKILRCPLRTLIAKEKELAVSGEASGSGIGSGSERLGGSGRRTGSGRRVGYSAGHEQREEPD